MATRTAWVLNLDADLELAAARYTPKDSVREAMRPWIERIAPELLGPGDILVDASTSPGSARGLHGRAFCPTPSAVALLERAGASPEPHPSVDVLRRVNSRAFAASLGPTLPGAEFVVDFEAAITLLSRDPEIAKDWRIKRAFGMAGRGQRIVTPGAPAEADRRLVRASVGEGGVQIEPNVAIAREYAVHGVLAEDGAVRLGDLVVQRCDAYGAWIASECASDADATEDVRGAIAKEAALVAAALHEAGYFGPFGVDAFTYRDRSGTLRLQPRSEINARYTMGFASSGLLR